MIPGRRLRYLEFAWKVLVTLKLPQPPPGLANSHCNIVHMHEGNGITLLRTFFSLTTTPKIKDACPT